MGQYADKMIEMMNRIGQPQTTTTTVDQPPPGIDLSALIMMLMMKDMFKDGQPQEEASGAGGMNFPFEKTSPLGAIQHLMKGGAGAMSPEASSVSPPSPVNMSGGVPGSGQTTSPASSMNNLTYSLLAALMNPKKGSQGGILG